MTLDHIANFRDVHLHCPEIRPGVLFRSGHTLFASQRDADRVLGQYGVRTVVDLRADGDAEVRASLGDAAANTEPVNLLIQRLERVPLEVAASGTPLLAPSTTNARFGSRRQRLAYIWTSTTLVELLLVIVCALLCMRRRAQAILARAFARDGLAGLYCGMISGSGRHIAQVLKVVAVNISEGAVLIHCSLGKDRTGVIIALILMIVGVDLKHIVADYEETGRAIPLETRKALIPSSLLDKDVFADADGQVIRQLAEFIQNRYGSLDQYLDSIGFNRMYRQMLRTHLLNEKKFQ